jgi:hypothetical protein
MDYFGNGNAIIDVGSGAIYTNQYGKLFVNPRPTQVALVRTSERYDTALKTLDQYAHSGQVPDDVRGALQSLKNTVDLDMDVMIKTLDEQVASNPNGILENFNPVSPRAGSVDNAFWHRIKPLQPEADKVRAAINSHLRQADKMID